MAGDPMIINLVEGAELVTKICYTGRKVPIHYRKAAEELINKLKEKGIIRQTQKSQAPVFCARGFFDPKSSGDDVRLVVDNSEVNKSIKRPVHPFLAGPDQLTIIPPEATVFCKLDALWGFYQIELAEESRHITTFITEFGTFKFCRAPMGLNCSGDEFCRRSDDALRGLPGVVKLIDDILVYASNYSELFERVENVLQRCTEHNITLSRTKNRDWRQGHLRRIRRLRSRPLTHCRTNQSHNRVPDSAQRQNRRQIISGHVHWPRVQIHP